MVNIIIFGSYSGNNKGDLAILTAILNKLVGNSDVRKIYIPSKNPSLLTKFLFNPKLLFFKSLTSYWGFKTISYIRKSDIIIVGGGGIFFSNKIFNPFFNHLINIFFISLINNIFFKKPVYIMTIGMTHLETRVSKLLAKYILQTATIITVRDHLSLNIAKQICSKSIKMFADPAFTLSKPFFKLNKTSNEFKYTNSNLTKIIICINATLLEKKFNQIVSLINQLTKTSFVLLFENSYNLQNLHRLAKVLNVKNLCILRENKLSPVEIIQLISKFDIVISAPMHFSIFAHIARRPTILIEYNKKVKQLSKLLCNNNLFKISDLSKISILVNDPNIISAASTVPLNILRSSEKGLLNMNKFISQLAEKKHCSMYDC